LTQNQANIKSFGKKKQEKAGKLVKTVQFLYYERKEIE